MKTATGVGTAVDTQAGEPRRTTAVVEYSDAAVGVLRCGTGLPADDDPEARGVALGALVGVLHRLDLPPADTATMPKLIEAQLETLIPGQAEHLRWGWQRETEGGPVLVVAAARRRLEALLDAAALDAEPSTITTPAAALHQVFTTCCGEDDRQRLHVVVRQPGRCYLLSYLAGGLVSLDTIDLGSAGGDASSEAIAAIVRQHIDATYAETGVDVLQRGYFTLVGEASPTAEEVSAFEKTLELPHRRADGLLRLPGLDRITAANLIAVGAALGAARPGHTINLTAGEAMAHGDSVYRPSRSRWIAAAALLLGALVLLYVSDTQRAERLETAVETSGVEAKDLTALNTDLAVARYLETSGPGFLAILDEFGHHTEGFMVDEIRFERDGTFTMRATAGSAEQVNQLAVKLADMKTLTSVRIRNQVVKDRDKIEYTLIAEPSPRFFAPFAPPREQSSEAKAAQPGGNLGPGGGA